MTVTGVNRHFAEPPQSLNEGDLPAAFPLMPGAVLGEPISSCTDMGKTRTIGYVICINPFSIDTNAENYGDIPELLDNLETALDDTLGTAYNFHDYEITSGSFAVGGVNYWAITATITVRSSYG
jgi:hypothetical protein